MACGTGKTLVGLWACEAMGSNRTLVLMPSLSLVKQISREWYDNAIETFRAKFVCSDLSQVSGEEPWLNGDWDRILLDPARSGADGLLPQLQRIGAQRLVYVSCHPGTLARDEANLVAGGGYRLEAAGIIDMFPHTAHVESIAVFEKNNK